MPNLRTRPEGNPENPFKQSLLMPAFRPPIPRSLVTEDRFKPSVELPVGMEIRGPGEAVPPLPSILIVQEEPYSVWRVDTLAVTLLASLWLDDPAAGRYMENRRSVIVTNHDTGFGVWSRETGVGVITGGYLAPGRSISFPLGSRCKVYAQGINPAGQNLSFYQFGAAVTLEQSANWQLVAKE